MQISTIGLDIAKNVFQVHGIDAAEKVVVRKRLRRRQVLEFFKALPPCLIGMEACATAHYWARELTKLGHRVRLMPAKDVKAYVKRNKNDAADAEAICDSSATDHALRADQIGRTAGSVDAASHARCADTPAHPDHQRLAGASGRARVGGGAGRQRGEGIARDRGGRRGCALPIDARASVIVLAAQLEAVQTLIGSIEKRIRCSIARTRRASGLKPSRASGSRGERDYGDGGGPDGISVGTRFRGLDRARAATGFNRGQAEAWADLQAGRSLLAAHSHRRSDFRVAARPGESWEVSLAHATPGAATFQGRGGGARQQDGAHGVALLAMVAPIGRLSLLKLPKGARRGREEEM